MGGNALKNTFTRRYQKDEYFQLEYEIIPKLDMWYGVSRIQNIPAYFEKESFGDMDILYTTFDDTPLSVDIVKTIFHANEYVRNSDVISFDYKELQIDLIHITQDHYDYALRYFSWNDCGNLVGKLAHQLGLKHGHKGLVLPLRDANNKFCDITLTLDHGKTLEFLGLDRGKFEDGFDNLDQIFNFISSSPYYNPENYKLENLNNVAKIRDRKRETYRKFLEYGEKWAGPVYKRKDNMNDYLEQIFKFFPEAYDSYIAATNALAVQQVARSKFNGDIVSSLTELTGKELGEFMKILRNNWYFRQENIVYLPYDDIVANILKKFNAHKKAQDNHTIREIKHSMNNLF